MVVEIRMAFRTLGKEMVCKTRLWMAIATLVDAITQSFRHAHHAVRSGHFWAWIQTTRWIWTRRRLRRFRIPLSLPSLPELPLPSLAALDFLPE